MIGVLRREGRGSFNIQKECEDEGRIGVPIATIKRMPKCIRRWKRQERIL